MFIAIDNVSNVAYKYTIEQIWALFKMQFAEGSIILVTACTCDVLTSWVGIPICDCLEMCDLIKDDAKSLFLYHASCEKGSHEGMSQHVH